MGDDLVDTVSCEIDIYRIVLVYISVANDPRGDRLQSECYMLKFPLEAVE